jgi:hypothetical protein
LVQQSAACQVRVMDCEQPLPLVTVLTTVIVTLVPQHSSNALGQSNVQVVPHSTVLLLAQVMTGASASTNVTVCVQVAVLLQPSLTVQVLVITQGQGPLLVTVVKLTLKFEQQISTMFVGASNVHDEPQGTILLVTHVMVMHGFVVQGTRKKAASPTPRAGVPGVQAPDEKV